MLADLLHPGSPFAEKLLRSLEHVHTCRLEVGGALSFVAREPTAEERRHRELLTRLDQLGQNQEVLRARVAALEARRAPRT